MNDAFKKLCLIFLYPSKHLFDKSGRNSKMINIQKSFPENQIHIFLSFDIEL